jgi:hypothetical protein
MANSSPLTGVVLIDCARANASQGLAIAAQQCGYGSDIAQFQAALRDACRAMNLTPKELDDLVGETPNRWRPPLGLEIAPDSPGEL